MIPPYLYTASFPTGSSYICNPPVLNTDQDEMFLCNNLQIVNEILLNLGWTKCGLDLNEPYDNKPSHWAAYRKNNLNALITTNINYFMLMLKLTEQAKYLNILDKQARIEFFQKGLGEYK